MRRSSAILALMLAASVGTAVAQRPEPHRDLAPRPAHRQPSWPAPPTGHHNGIQVDIGTLLAEPGPVPAAEREPAPVNRPTFSNGWTRDGFGGQPGGWR